MEKKTILKLFTLLVLALFVAGGFGTAVYAQTDDSTAQQDDDSAQTDDSAQQDSDSTPAQQARLGSVYDVIVADARLSSFETLVNAAGLANNLDQDGPFTVFAPTNDAWAAYEAMVAEATADDSGTESAAASATLTQVLLYHVVNGNYPAGVVAGRNSVATLLGEPVSFSSDSQGLMLDDGARVAAADIAASNGVVHIIDTVLLPPVNSVFTSPLGSPEQTIAEVLESDGRFEALLTLMDQAGLMDELRDESGDYTLFAPTDDAFDAIPEEEIGEWLAPGNSQFVGFMAYHLVTDRLGINQIATDDLIPTLEGRPLFVTTDDQLGVYLNDHPITEFNIVASNGVIHVVDSVLMP